MLKPKFHSIFDDIAIGMQMLSDNLVKEDEVVSNIEKDNQDNVPPPFKEDNINNNRTPIMEKAASGPKRCVYEED